MGDAGTTEVRGPTRRYGVEVGARGQIFGPFYLNGSFTVDTRPIQRRARHSVGAGLNRIYGIDHAMAGGSCFAATNDLSRSEEPDRGSHGQKRHRGPVFDLTERYQLPIKLSHGRLEAFLFVQNLLDTHWEGATFAFTSRLPNEPAAGVQDIHFVPGNPRFLWAAWPGTLTDR